MVMTMTQPRAWPNKAKWARDDSAVLFQKIVRESRQLLEHQDMKVALAAARMLDHAQRGRSYLVDAGANVRDDEL